MGQTRRQEQRKATAFSKARAKEVATTEKAATPAITQRETTSLGDLAKSRPLASRAIGSGAGRLPARLARSLRRG
jgi:hypothetical protein